MMIYLLLIDVYLIAVCLLICAAVYISPVEKFQ